MQGVFLDTETVNPEQLDFSALAALMSWTFHPFTAPAQRIARLQEAEVVVTNKVVLDADTLAACPSLKLICICATGTNNVDLHAAREQGITVCNVSGYARASVAQHSLMLMLNLATRCQQYDRAVKQGRWSEAGSSVCWITRSWNWPARPWASSVMAIWAVRQPGWRRPSGCRSRWPSLSVAVAMKAGCH